MPYNQIPHSAAASGAESWPSYEDVASGLAPMPDIPGVSLNPLIIPPCPPTARECSVDMRFSIGNVQIGENTDGYLLARDFKKALDAEFAKIARSFDEGTH